MPKFTALPGIPMNASIRIALREAEADESVRLSPPTMVGACAAGVTVRYSVEKRGDFSLQESTVFYPWHRVDSIQRITP